MRPMDPAGKQKRQVKTLANNTASQGEALSDGVENHQYPGG